MVLISNPNPSLTPLQCSFPRETNVGSWRTSVVPPPLPQKSWLRRLWGGAPTAIEPLKLSHAISTTSGPIFLLSDVFPTRLSQAKSFSVVIGPCKNMFEKVSHFIRPDGLRVIPVLGSSNL